MARGSVFAPRLGLHVHVALRQGTLTAVRLSGAPAPSVDAEARPILERLARHCERGDDAFADVPVDLSGLAPFHRRVLEALRDVPPGKTVGYGELARRVGSPGASRAVGGAMARNPMPVVVPCHRVLPSGGRVGNYSGEGGWRTKLKLLQIEGVAIEGLPQAQAVTLDAWMP